MNISLFGGFKDSATEGVKLIGTTTRTALLILCGCALLLIIIKLVVDAGK